MAPKWDVFVSYAGPDEEVARRYAIALQEHDLSVCCTALPPPPGGGQWHVLVAQAIASARCIVFLVGATSGDADGQALEISSVWKQARKRTIDLQVRLLASNWPSPAEPSVMWDWFSSLVREGLTNAAVAQNASALAVELGAQPPPSPPLPWWRRRRVALAGSAVVVSAVIVAAAVIAGPLLADWWRGAQGSLPESSTPEPSPPLRHPGSIAATAQVAGVTLVWLDAVARDDGSVRDTSACERRALVAQVLPRLAAQKPRAVILDAQFDAGASGCAQTSELGEAIREFRRLAPGAALMAIKTDQAAIGRCSSTGAACFDALLDATVPLVRENTLSPSLSTCPNNVPHVSWVLDELRMAELASAGGDSWAEWVRGLTCESTKQAALRPRAGLGMGKYTEVSAAAIDEEPVIRDHVVVVGFRAKELERPGECEGMLDRHRVQGSQECVYGAQLLVEAAMLFEEK